MRQSKVLAVAPAENKSKLEALLECESISRMATVEPVQANIERALSLPADAVVLYSNELTAEECGFIEKIYMSRQSLAFILICDRTDTTLLSRGMRSGFTKVLTSDAMAPEICRSIENEILRIQSRGESAKVQEYDSRVISVFGTKGGCGKTTLAVNLAHELFKSGKKTAIVDLSLAFGDVAVFMDLPHCETIYDLTSEKVLTPAIVTGALYKNPSGPDVLPAPSSPEFAEEIKPELIARITDILRAEYDYVILDLPASLDDNTLMAIEHSDTVYYVVLPEIPTLRNARSCMNVLSVLKYTEKLRLVLNRDGDEFITKKDIAACLEMKPVLIIPEDRSTASISANKGIPAVISRPRSPMSRVIKKYVKKEIW